jgi:hypothetical protein
LFCGPEFLDEGLISGVLFQDRVYKALQRGLCLLSVVGRTPIQFKLCLRRLHARRLPWRTRFSLVGCRCGLGRDRRLPGRKRLQTHIYANGRAHATRLSNAVLGDAFRK